MCKKLLCSRTERKLSLDSQDHLKGICKQLSSQRKGRIESEKHCFVTLASILYTLSWGIWFTSVCILSPSVFFTPLDKSPSVGAQSLHFWSAASGARSWEARAAITIQQTRGLNNRHLLLTIQKARKSKIKVVAWAGSGESCPPGLCTAGFSLCSHRAERDSL